MLSDPKKRAIYDQRGEEGIKEGGGSGPGMDPRDIFSMFFGGGGGMGSLFTDATLFFGLLLCTIKVSPTDILWATKFAALCVR